MYLSLYISIYLSLYIERDTYRHIHVYTHIYIYIYVCPNFMLISKPGAPAMLLVPATWNIIYTYI